MVVVIKFDTSLNASVRHPHPIGEILEDVEVRLEEIWDFHPHTGSLALKFVAGTLDKVTDGRRCELDDDFILDLGPRFNNPAGVQRAEVAVHHLFVEAQLVNQEGDDFGAGVPPTDRPKT